MATKINNKKDNRYRFITLRLRMEDYYKIFEEANTRHLRITTYCKVIIFDTIEKYLHKNMPIKLLSEEGVFLYLKNNNKKGNEHKFLFIRLLSNEYKEFKKVVKSHGLKVATFTKYILLKSIDKKNEE